MLKSSPECSLTNAENYGKHYMHYLEMFLGFLRTVLLFFEPIVRYFWLSWIEHCQAWTNFILFSHVRSQNCLCCHPHNHPHLIASLSSSSSPWSSSSSASMPALKIVCIINTGNDGEAANLVKLPCRRRSQSTEYSSDSHTLKRTLMRNINVWRENVFFSLREQFFY